VIVFTIYLILLAGLIWLNGFFGVFNVKGISRRTFVLVFILKAAAVPLFYYLYLKMYGGIDNLDAGKFYHDSVILNDLAHKNFPEYLKMLVGLQNEAEGSYFYKEVNLPTYNWDNGALKDFFYNDNRVVIRIHSLLHFIAFGCYFAHAILNCFIGFIGMTMICKALAPYFDGKEKWLLFIICFFPSLWFYSAAVLKESYTVFVLGAILLTLKRIFETGFSPKNIFFLIVLAWISLLLKPYVLFFALIYFSLAFFILKKYKGKFKFLVFGSSMVLMFIVLNLLSSQLKNQSLSQAAYERKRTFADMANGGIFLCDTGTMNFIRLKYDYSLVKKVNEKPEIYTIRPNTQYYYWEFSHQQDTLFCSANRDTLTKYKLMYDIPTAGSNFDIGSASSGTPLMLLKGLYASFRYPFFFDARGLMQIIASFENLLLIIAVIAIIAIGLIICIHRDNYMPLVLLFFGLSLFTLVGMTTPNIGALLRYRSPAAVFILISALHYISVLKNCEYRPN
jgi:hypothetical protein